MRGLVVIVVITVAAGVSWRISRPDHSGQIEFALAATDLGDGVSTSTTVRLRGMQIGSVVGIEPHGLDRQLITLSVDRARVDELTTSMQTRFVSANIFGSTALEFIPMPGGDPIRPNSLLDLGDDVGNFTVTKILRDSGHVVLDVLTSKLAVSLDDAAALTQQMTPMLASALLVMRAIARSQNMPLRDLLPRLAEVTEGVSAFTPSALGIVHSLASVDALDDEARSRQAGETISEVSNLVFSFAGQVVGALGPMSGAVDMLLDILIPLNAATANVTGDQIRRLVAGLDGALQRRGDKVVLGVDVLIDAFPAFRVPLEATGGGPR